MLPTTLAQADAPDAAASGDADAAINIEIRADGVKGVSVNGQDVAAGADGAAEGSGEGFDAPATFDDAWRTVLDSIGDMWEAFLRHLPLLLIGILVIVATWGIAKLAASITSRLTEKTRMRTSLRDLIRQLVTIAVWVAGLLVAIVVLFPGMTPTRAIGLLGIGSVAIGFAFKDIFENFLAGILILWRFPFDPGDYVECNVITGKVEDITIRMTLIRQTDGQLVTVPNATLFKDPVTVMTQWKKRRITVMCGVAYDEDIAESRGVIEKAVASCETVMTDEPIQIFAQAFGASSIDFEVTWWTGPTPLDVRKSRDEVVEKVKAALDAAGIEIPFPYRTLTFKPDYPMHLAGRGDESTE